MARLLLDEILADTVMHAKTGKQQHAADRERLLFYSSQYELRSTYTSEDRLLAHHMVKSPACIA
eukprot:228781-Pleurochrysis_carterae.AAC.5